MKWKVETDNNGNINIIESFDGTFDTFEEAEEYGKKIAKENKKILKFFTEDGLDDEATLDYTSILLPDEIMNKQESEFKIASAEKMVISAEIKKWKNHLANANTIEDKEKYKAKIKDAKQRYSKSKIDLKDAKRKLKEVNKINKNDLF